MLTFIRLKRKLLHLTDSPTEIVKCTSLHLIRMKLFQALKSLSVHPYILNFQ